LPINFDSGLVGDRQNHRDEHRDDGRRIHKCPDPAREHHDEHDQSCLATAASLQHSLAQTLRDPGIHQRLANDKDRGNQDHHRIAKAGQ
jgi:hypothetical protein